MVLFIGSKLTISMAMINGYVKLPEGKLLGGINQLEKYESPWEGLSHILWKIKNGSSHHQPVSDVFSPCNHPMTTINWYVAADVD